MEHRPPKVRLLVLVLLFGMTLGVYWSTLAPAVTSEDSGELITALEVQGVPHPPGYPTWCLVSRVCGSLLAGLGELGWTSFLSPAYRSNWLSALYGAGAAAGCFLFLEGLTGGLMVPAAMALVMAFGRTTWSQAVITEVYTLNLLFLFFGLYLLHSYARTRRAGHLWLAALLTGLGLANHWPLTVLGLGPVWVLVLWLSFKDIRSPDGRSAATWTRLLVGGGLLVLGLTPYLLMMRWATLDPPLNWGDPSSAARLVRHVSRSAYGQLESGSAGSLREKVLYLADFGRFAWIQFCPPVVFLALLGLRSAVRVHRRFGPVLLGMLLLNPVLLVARLHYPFTTENRNRLDEFYLPAFAVIVILAATVLARWLRSGSRWRGLVAVLTLALPAWTWLHNREFNDLGDRWLTADHNRALLHAVAEEALIFPSGDNITFPLAYLTIVEGLRPDVLLGDLYGNHLERGVRQLFVRVGQVAEVAVPALQQAGLPTSAGLLDERLEALQQDESEADRGLLKVAQDAVMASLVEHSGRPVFFAARRDVPFRQVRDPADPARPYFEIIPAGLLYRVIRSSSAGAVAPVFLPPDAPPLRNLELPVERLHDLERGLVSRYHGVRAEACAAAGNREEARAAFAVAARYAWPDQEGMNNLGSACAEFGYLDLAERYWLRALEISPWHRTSRNNLLKIYTQLLDLTEGASRADVARKLAFHQHQARVYSP